MEANYVLSIDPASNSCGVSLWKSNTYLSSAVLKSNHSRDPFSIRVRCIVTGLDRFLGDQLAPGEEITTVVSEGVRSRLVHLAFGAILTSQYIRANVSPKTTFIEPQQWKKYARALGATGDFKDIKGVKALQEAGWDMKNHPIDSDDVADSILIYQTWCLLYGSK